MGQEFQFVIERVLERGTLEEWREIKRYYGLDNTTLSFCSTIFNVPKEQFRCYALKSLNPALWVF